GLEAITRQMEQMHEREGRGGGTGAPRLRPKRGGGQQALLERGARETLRAQWRFNQALGFPSAQVPDTPGMPGPGAAWGAGVAARMAAAQTRQAEKKAEALPGRR